VRSATREGRGVYRKINRGGKIIQQKISQKERKGPPASVWKITKKKGGSIQRNANRGERSRKR